MFFLLSKFLNWFVYPLSLLLVGLFVILVFYRRRYTHWGLACVLLLFYSVSAPILVQPLVRWLEGPPPSPEALRPHYDVALVLTGMGSDGMRGGKEIVAIGGSVIAQDEASSVVWGMPGAAANAGICAAILPLDQIAPKLVRLFSGDRS